MTILETFKKNHKEFIDQMLEHIEKIHEMSIIEEIVATSRGIWDSYDQYLAYKKRQQTEAIESNLKFKRTYALPVTYVLTEAQFNYARSFYDKK